MKLMLVASAMPLAVCSMLSPAQAAPVLASSAYGASVDLKVAGAVKADALFGPHAGLTPPEYDSTVTLANNDQSALLVAPGVFNASTSATDTLGTGAVSSRIFATDAAATGTSEVDDAALSLGTSAQIAPAALGITADTIRSSTTAGVDSQGLYAFGSSSIAGLGVFGSALGALTIEGTLFADANPNTVLLNQLGVLITLNEQGKTLGATTITMFTNAVHVSLSNYLLGGRRISGDIILGHSQASVISLAPTSGIPEPAAWAMTIAGLGMVGLAMQGCRRRALPLRA